ncbi:unnamed protein product [Rotaria sp. Silwood2]|nr:unnamed protein product [Rotaria sp. Silwood2]
MAVNYLNEIISIFLQRNVNELSDNDLSTAIRAQGKTCSTEEIRRVVHSLSSSMFHLYHNHENIFLVRIELRINICKDFLAGKCNFKTRGCNQLHLCRYFGHCHKKDCHFPHDFTHGNNRRILEQSNCLNVNPILLTSTTSPVVSKTPDMTSSSSVQPKPIAKVFERSKRTHSRRRCRDGMSNRVAGENNIPRPTFLSSELDTNSQIDICFSSTSIARRITIEEIVEFLKLQGLTVQNVLNSKENEHFHQCTLQFQEKNVVDNILAQPSILYQGIHLKFKRTNPLIDQKSFVLQSRIDSKRGPITKEKFSLYTDLLINHCPFKFTDLSSAQQQILLIQCDNTIDFNQARRVQKSRRQLQGTDISLKQVYELDKAIVESIHNRLSIEIIENIIESFLHDVFTFTVQSSQTVLIEFINADSLKKWLLLTDITQQKFGVNIKLDVKCVDEDDYVDDNSAASCSSSDKLLPKSNERSILSQVTVYLRRGWAMVVNHPTFSIEYKNYIRSELGLEIEIHGNRIEAHRNSISSTLVKENTSTLLTNRTHNFMHKFAFRSIALQQSIEQLKILHAHSTTVAFCHIKDRNYMLATKKSNIEAIIQKLLPKKPIDKNPMNSRSSAASTDHDTTKNVDQKQLPTFMIPPPLLNSTTTNDKYIYLLFYVMSIVVSSRPPVTNEIIIKNVTLSSFNIPGQAALFTNKAFESSLETYFNKKYSCKLNFEHTADVNCRSLVKVIGRQSAVDAVIKELLKLFSLCRTKTFNETIDNDWIKMSDAVRVIQHHFDLMEIKCLCQQQTSPLSILVHYIDKAHTEFGIDEKIIERLCRKQLILTKCTSTTFENVWTALKTNIFQRDDYGKDICLFDEQQTISLYGLPEVVKHVQKLFEDKKTKYVPSVVKDQPSKPETLPISKVEGLKFENSLQSSESITHQQLNQTHILKKVQTYSIRFDVDEPGFEVLLNNDFNGLLTIIQSKCQLEKQIIHHQIQIQIPKARVNHFDYNASESQSQEDNSKTINSSNEASIDSQLNWLQRLFQRSKPTVTEQQQNSTSPVQLTSSVSIGNSRIIVCTGDLTKQTVSSV